APTHPARTRARSVGRPRVDRRGAFPDAADPAGVVSADARARLHRAEPSDVRASPRTARGVVLLARGELAARGVGGAQRLVAAVLARAHAHRAKGGSGALPLGAPGEESREFRGGLRDRGAPR